jgi:hypothetical protein
VVSGHIHPRTVGKGCSFSPINNWDIRERSAGACRARRPILEEMEFPVRGVLGKGYWVDSTTDITIMQVSVVFIYDLVLTHTICFQAPRI